MRNFILIMIALLLSACGGSGSSEETSDQSNGEETGTSFSISIINVGIRTIGNEESLTINADSLSQEGLFIRD